MNELKTLSYSTVNFAKKKELGITAQQYLYLDSVRVLMSNPKYNGWAYASNAYYAEMFDMSVRGVQKMGKVLSEKGLLILGKGSLRKISQNAYEIMTYEQSSPTNKVHPKHEQSSPQTRTKFTPKHEQSSPNNNKDSNKDKESDSKDLHPFVLENRKKVKAQVKASKEIISFSEDTKPFDALHEFMLTDCIGLIQKYPAFTALSRLDKIESLKAFSQKNAMIKEWANKKELAQHYINSLRYYKPIHQSEENVTKQVFKRRKYA